MTTSSRKGHGMEDCICAEDAFCEGNCPAMDCNQESKGTPMDKPLTDDELDALGKDGNWDSRYGERAIKELRALRDVDPAGLHPTCMAIQAAQTAEIDRLREDLAAAELRESIWRAGPDSTFELAQQNAALVTALVTMQLEFAGEHQYDGWREDTAGMFCASCETPESLPHRPGCAWWAAYEPSVRLVGTYSENAARVRGAE